MMFRTSSVVVLLVMVANCLSRNSPSSSGGELVTYVPGALVLSHTLFDLGGDVSAVFVDVEVDWESQLAYAASSDPETCVAVIDFSVRPPVLFAELGPTTTPAMAGVDCRGVSSYRPDRLLVSIGSADRVDQWSLGAIPRDEIWTLLSYTDVTDPGPVFGWWESWSGQGLVSTEDVITEFEIQDMEGSGAFNLVPGSTSVPTTSCRYGRAAGGSIDVAVGACVGEGNPVVVWQLSTMDEIDSYAMERSGGSAIHTTAISRDGTRLFAGGCVSAFIEVTGVASPELRARVDNRGCYRDGVFVTDQTLVGEYLYAVADDGFLDVWDVTDVSTPVLSFRAELAVTTGTLIGVEVSTEARRALVVSEAGDVVLVDIDVLPAVSEQPPTY